MRPLYPESFARSTGMLDVGDDQHIFWQDSGNPAGKPVVVLHGGPGSASSSGHRQMFDAERYRIIQFDQRGCGKSLPRVDGPGVDLTANTTWHLVDDIEKLRRHLGITTWQVFGGSWGSTLALAYAETHPERVTELVLRGVFTARQSELDWFSEGHIAQFHPEAWNCFREPLDPESSESTMTQYARLLADPDPAVFAPAAIAWAKSEVMAISIDGRPDLVALYDDVVEAYTTARLEHHYFANSAWFEMDQLLRRADLLAGIPTVIVQGRYDMLTPAITAWELHEVMPHSVLEIIENAGHSSDEPGIADALIRATDTFGRQ